MLQTSQVGQQKTLVTDPTARPNKKHIKLNEINYRNNSNSDYTEKIEELDKHFDYASNRDYYWSDPELSFLYGTPVYEQASEQQKKALNHLYWVIQYSNTASSEVDATLYNQITAGVFATVGGYETLCQELDLETRQEYDHIHAFQMIGYRTKKALLGKAVFNHLLANQSASPKPKKELIKSVKPQSKQNFFDLNWDSPRFLAYQDSALRFLAKLILKNKKHAYTEYFQELEKKGEAIPSPNNGYGRLAPRPLMQFFTINWGTSPFLATLFFVLRYTTNVLLKSQEHNRSKYFKDLERKGEAIPVPLAVSHYHFLDESFHTTTSLLIARDLYKDFPKPSPYESFVANAMVHMLQRNMVNFHSGVSNGLPARCFRDDAFMMRFVYELFQTSLFGMSPQESLHWVEKSFCQEHGGYQVGHKYHQNFMSDLNRFFGELDYLWSINREMSLVDKQGSIDKAVQNNIQAFKKFSESVAA